MRSHRHLVGLLIVAALAGCGSAGGAASTTKVAHAPTVPAPGPVHRPHAVEPIAGQVASEPQAAKADARGGGNDPKPSAPASSSAHPAKGALTDAQVNVEVKRFQAAVARYHLDRLNFSSALIDPRSLPTGVFQTSIASVYTDYGLPIACGGVLHVSQLGVAHKTLPCGTKVTFVYGGRAIRVPVIDRGPYIAGREWDLTGAAAQALHFPGLGSIRWRLG